LLQPEKKKKKKLIGYLIHPQQPFLIRQIAITLKGLFLLFCLVAPAMNRTVSTLLQNHLIVSCLQISFLCVKF